MMPRFKKTVLALLLLAMLLVLTSCGSPEATYKSANNLLAKGKYAEAAEKFASLGSYEDAAYLAIYADACVKGESDDPYVINEAVSTFYNLSGFKDSDMRATYYWGRFWENRGRYFENANAGDGFQFMEQALEYYESVPLFLDCPTRIKALKNELPPLMENAYNDAIKKAEAGNYTAADELFEKLDDYKDSKTRITYYDIREAEDLLDNSTDQDAVYDIAKRYSKLGNVIDCNNRATALYARADKIVTDKYAQVDVLINNTSYEEASYLLSEFGQYGNDRIKDYYILIAEKYLEQQKWDESYYTCYQAELDDDERRTFYHNTAEKLFAKGQYADAISILTEYISKDNAKRAKEIQEEHWLDMIQTADVGDSVFFGTYEQRDFYPGLEPIEWTVLAKEKNRLLVISSYALDSKPYNLTSTNVTWETCTLRKWLNSDFINTAFTKEQQKYIPTVIVPADQNPKSATYYSNVTNDKIFLLSISEVNKYFSTDEAMDCESPTGWSRWWWLRTPGENQDKAVFADDGGIHYFGWDVDDEEYVRPAMWIELNQ